MPAGQAINAPTEIMRLINWMMAHVSATVRTTHVVVVLVTIHSTRTRCSSIRHRSACVTPSERWVISWSARFAPAEVFYFLFFIFAIVECLDTGDEFPCEGPDGDHRALVAAFANTLVVFLDSLIEPVVPARLHAQCLQARDKDEAFEVLNGFPHESINVGGHLVGTRTSSTDGLTSTCSKVWISLTACLHYIAQQRVPKEDTNPTGSKTAHSLGMFTSRRSSCSHVLTDGQRASLLLCYFAMTLLAFIREHRPSENVIFFSVSSTKRPHDAFNQEIKKMDLSFVFITAVLSRSTPVLVHATRKASCMPSFPSLSPPFRVA